ncbi:MAG: hypothetical protein QOI66_516 [Myxococcales bacterium]|nr:hypothetical protein [Myxococcales bacterium]
MSALANSVGRGGVNGSPDTRLVQRLLNDARGLASLPLLRVDGIAGPKTIAAIELYQKTKGLTVDGRADVTGRTIKQLMSDHVANLTSGSRGSQFHLKHLPAPSMDLLAGALGEYWQTLKQA